MDATVLLWVWCLGSLTHHCRVWPRFLDCHAVTNFPWAVSNAIRSCPSTFVFRCLYRQTKIHRPPQYTQRIRSGVNEHSAVSNITPTQAL
ncbi:hypothetical protein F4680DRAFT_37648 [Xylaria scruposa]|nr:hypothetical protein F4680DRAFT_37648 [Xylaria scruposa]